jgi:hypothetical protein
MARGDSYVITREEAITRIDFKRNPDSEEMVALLATLDEMKDTALRMYVMIEAEVLLSTAEVREGADTARSFSNQPTRVAIVAPGDITYGISRIFKVFRESDSTQLQVFRELDEARGWLLSDPD